MAIFSICLPLSLSQSSCVGVELPPEAFSLDASWHSELPVKHPQCRPQVTVNGALLQIDHLACGVLPDLGVVLLAHGVCRHVQTYGALHLLSIREV